MDFNFSHYNEFSGTAAMIADVNGYMRWANKEYANISGLDLQIWMNRDVGDISKRGIIKFHGERNLMYNEVKKTGNCVTRTIDFPETTSVITTAIPYHNNYKIEFIIYNLSSLNSCQKENKTVPHISADGFVIKNQKTHNVYFKAHQIAPYDASVLITGESGTGKDKIAKYIHNASNRKGKFVHINCGAIPEQLFESNMFGYESGAFTGALKGGCEGFIKQASGGTLFLDEIGDMPVELQTKLLTFLEHKQFIKVGGKESIDCDTRIIAATNKDLKLLAIKGLFREDLFYRLSTIEIELPALRERRNEIPYFIDFFSHMFNSKYNREILFDKESVEMLNAYDWPGNIRELRHVVEKLILLSSGKHIKSDLILSECGTLFRKSLTTNESLKMKLEKYEKTLIKSALETSRTLLDASKLLNIDLSTLTRKRQKHKI